MTPILAWVLSIVLTDPSGHVSRMESSYATHDACERNLRRVEHQLSEYPAIKVEAKCDREYGA